MKRNIIDNKVFRFFQSVYVELLIFFVMVFSLIITAPEQVYGFVTAWYVADYSIGISSRLLIGSILRLIFGDYISAAIVFRFIIVSYLVIFALLSYLMGQCVKKSGTNESKIGIVMVLAIYLASPASPGYLWVSENMGRLDTYIYLITVIIVIAAVKVNKICLRYILLSLLGVIAILTHQVFLFLFFPVLLSILILDVFSETRNRSKIIGSFITAGLVSIVFLFFQFKSSVHFSNPEELTAVLQSRTDLPISYYTILFEYFWTIKDHFIQNMLPELRERVRFGIITVVLLSPILFAYGSIWIYAIKNSKKETKFKYLLVLLTNIMYLPVFILMTDWGRWFAAFFISQTLIIVYIYLSGDPNFKIAIQKFGNYIIKKPIIPILILLYLSMFDKFEGINYLPQVEAFYYKVYAFKTFLLGLL